MHQMGLYMVYVGFDQLKDEAERDRFFKIKTTFNLPVKQVDSLRTIGGLLLEQSKCFQQLTNLPNDHASGAKTCY